MKEFAERDYIHLKYPKYRELGLNSWEEVYNYIKPLDSTRLYLIFNK